MLKRIIRIDVADAFAELLGAFGEFTERDVQFLAELATKKNMVCLSFIDIPRNTYFNATQCVEIKKELLVLRECEELSKRLLDSIEEAADLAIKEQAFVVFEVLKV